MTTPARNASRLPEGIRWTLVLLSIGVILTAIWVLGLLPPDSLNVGIVYQGF